MTLIFPRGLYYTSDTGAPVDYSVKVEMEYSADGLTGWTQIGDPTTISTYDSWWYYDTEGQSYYKYDSYSGTYLGVTSQSLPNGAIQMWSNNMDWNYINWYAVPLTYTANYTTITNNDSSTFGGHLSSITYLHKNGIYGLSFMSFRNLALDMFQTVIWIKLKRL